MDIKTAVDRLNSQLPLKERQEELSRSLKSVHQKMLYSLVQAGRPMNQEELAKQLGEENVETGLQTLGTYDLVVLDSNKKFTVGAYPVTMEQTPHKININCQTIYAMCALDAVAVAPIFNTEVLIDSSCCVSRTPIKIQMNSDTIIKVRPSDDVTVGVRWQMPSNVAAHSMCMEMVFLKDRETAESWQAGDSENKTLFALPEAVEFGSAFFRPLLN